MSQPPSQPAIKRSRIKGNACSHCRVKKLKCDGDKPACCNCRKRGIECTTPSLQRTRPTNGRIRELEQETRRLREELCRGRACQQDQNRAIRPPSLVAYARVDRNGATLPGCSPGQDEQDPVANIETLHAANASKVTLPTRTQARLETEAPDNLNLDYHGPTSVLYDDSTPPDGGFCNLGHAPIADAAWMRCTLVVETSKQRQLEPINFSLNLLDFDGVEPELGMQLLSLYWSRQLHAGMLVYRPAFMRDMACGGPYFSKLLLNAMYYSVSKHSPNESIRRDASNRDSAGWSFRQRFKELLGDEFDKSAITTIQALLIMASSLFTRCDERSISWLYAGNAFNMLTDMGLHVWSAHSRTTKPEESEIHTRVFWAAYMIDKVQCLYQGRHPSLRIADTNTSFIFHDDYEELEKFDHNSFLSAEPANTAPSFTISTFKALCELSTIMERIHSKIYAASYVMKTSREFVTQSNLVYSDLKAWRKNLPRHLDFMTFGLEGTPLPYNLSMLALYDALIILTSRLLPPEEQSNSPSPTWNAEASTSSVTAANEIVEILDVYGRLYNPSSATFSLSYATYISAKVHLHTLFYHGGRHECSLDSLRICLSALDEHQKLYSAASRAKEMLLKLMNRLGLRIDKYAGFSSTNVQLVQAPRGPSIPKGSAPSAHVEFLVQPTTIDFEVLDTGAGLNGSYENISALDQTWLSATEFMTFDDLYYEDS